MGILDALAVLGGGYGKGYRSGQDTQRQIEEDRRKALLDERAQRLQESLAPSEIGLRTAQMSGVNADTSLANYKLQEAKAQRDRLDQILTPNGGPISLPLGNNTINIPGTGAGISDYENFIKEFLSNDALLKAAGIRKEGTIGAANARVNYLTNFSKGQGTPDQRRKSYLTKILTAPNPFMDPQDQQAYTQYLLGIAKQNDPEAFGITPVDTTNVKTKTKSNASVVRKDGLTDQEAYQRYLKTVGK